MKTLVVAAQKGGQGKTAMACHLAFDFAERGLRVVVIDLDAQGNASWTLGSHRTVICASELFSASAATSLAKHLKNFSGERLTLVPADAGLANLDKMEISKAANSLRQCIGVLEDHFDVCIIDTAPSLGVGMTSALLSSDFIMTPIEMEAYSLRGMKMMVSLFTNLRQQNPKLKFLGMLPNRVDSRKPRHIANLDELKKAYAQLLMPVSIGARDSIAEALGAQMPVWHIKRTAARKAIKEVRGLADYVYKKMELANGR